MQEGLYGVETTESLYDIDTVLRVENSHLEKVPNLERDRNINLPNESVQVPLEKIRLMFDSNFETNPNLTVEDQQHASMHYPEILAVRKAFENHGIQVDVVSPEDWGVNDTISFVRDLPDLDREPTKLTRVPNNGILDEIKQSSFLSASSTTSFGVDIYVETGEDLIIKGGDIRLVTDQSGTPTLLVGSNTVWLNAINSITESEIPELKEIERHIRDMRNYNTLIQKYRSIIKYNKDVYKTPNFTGNKTKAEHNQDIQNIINFDRGEAVPYYARYLYALGKIAARYNVEPKDILVIPSLNYHLDTFLGVSPTGIFLAGTTDHKRGQILDTSLAETQMILEERFGVVPVVSTPYCDYGKVITQFATIPNSKSINLPDMLANGVGFTNSEGKSVYIVGVRDEVIVDETIRNAKSVGYDIVVPVVIPTIMKSAAGIHCLTQEVRTNI